MNKLDKDYINLIQDVLTNGIESGDRTGTGTKKTFVNVLKHDMRSGFPLLTSKFVYSKGVFVELLWFLSGQTNIKYMVDNNVYIWVGDSYKNYKKQVENPISEDEFINAIKTDNEFAKKYGELGPVYGSQWRNWNNEDLDQLTNVINDLKTNPESRRHIVTAWNPGKVKDMVLPPCHILYQFQTEEIPQDERILMLHKKLTLTEIINELNKSNDYDVYFEKYNIPKYYLNLVFNMRSVDVGLGLPFDIASYGALLEMVAKDTNMVAKTLACTLVDTHIYKDQIEFITELFDREIHTLPKLWLNPDKSIYEYTINDIKIENYTHSGKLFLPLSN